VPPISVTWGEQSKDEMGAVTLVGVPHDEADLQVLRREFQSHRGAMARQRMLTDPATREKVRELLEQ
jgi:hypothetical protein